MPFSFKTLFQYLFWSCVEAAGWVKWRAYTKSRRLSSRSETRALRNQGIRAGSSQREGIEDSALRLIPPVDSVETGLRRRWSALPPTNTILFSYLQRRETITSFTLICVYSIASHHKLFLYTLHILATQCSGDKGPFYLLRLSRRVDQSDVNTINFPPLPQPPRRDPPQNLVFASLNSSNRKMYPKHHKPCRPSRYQSLGYRYSIPASAPREPRIPVRSPRRLRTLFRHPF